MGPWVNMIPIAKPNIGEEEKNAVIKVLDSGMLAQGSKVKEFEDNFSEYIGTKYAIATNNGTTALHMALLSCGVEKGDEVITTPFSFIATVTSIIFCNAIPVFVDIEPKTFNMDPEKIEDAVTKNTKAIMVVHLYGQSCQMDKINKIAEKYDLKIIEDACQAHGAEFKRKRAGSIGDVGCFSFYPTKNMTTGEGGMITTNDHGISEKIKLLRNHGQQDRYDHVIIGYNYRMTDMAATIGIEQLKKLDRFNNKRTENADYLTKNLPNNVVTPVEMENVKHVFHQYTIRCKNRNKLINKLKENGIGSGIYYPKCLHQYQPLKKYQKNNLIEAEKATSEVLSLPIHPLVMQNDLNKIKMTIQNFYSSKKLGDY